MTSSRLALAAALALAGAFANPAFAEDRTDLEGSKIIGNRELPKVLYIVPWKKPVPGAQSAHPPKSVLDEALAPIDRDVFRRERAYDTQAHATAAPPAAAPAPATAPAAH
jgi:hypothetical protein